jgi:hypothetical protein
MENLNSPKQLEDIKIQVFKILDHVEAVPGAPIFTGQIGTTQIPEDMDVVVSSAGGKASIDTASS